MFFDQIDERNTMVMYVLAFEEVGQVGLADFRSPLSRLWLDRAQKSCFLLARAPNAMIQVSFLAILTIETWWGSPLCTLNTCQQVKTQKSFREKYFFKVLVLKACKQAIAILQGVSARLCRISI